MAKNRHEPGSRYQGQGLGEPYFSGSVGQTFAQRRVEIGLTLTDIARETRIQERYLKAIEASDWGRIPHTVHILGFIRTYARLLGLDSSIAATKYLLERGPIATVATAKPPRPAIRQTIVGSRLLIGGVVAVILIAVVGYLLVQLSVLAAPPPLEISSPATDQEVTGNSLDIRGKTAAGAVVTINGSPVAVGDDGGFVTTITLNDGLNTIRFEARNRAGKVAKAERNVLIRR